MTGQIASNNNIIGSGLSEDASEDSYDDPEESPSKEMIERTASELLEGLRLDQAHPHGSNIVKKAADVAGDPDSGLHDVIKSIAEKYLEWRKAAEALDCPDVNAPDEFVKQQTALYQDYRNVLDAPEVDGFDSRGALQPSALEEFCYFLVRPLVESQSEELALGHREVFQGLYFTARDFASFAKMPQPHYPTGNLDFVIAKKVSARMKTPSDSHTQDLFLPAVAIECKTYLDRPRWIESDILASSIKRGFPGCLYILVSEFLKLRLEKVNVLGSQIDKVYVLRRAKNVDRKIRRANQTALQEIHWPAVVDLFCAIRDHLNDDWVSPEDWQQSGVLK